MVYKYNIPLLDYNISIAAGIRNHGARTLIEINNEILKKLREIFNFA